MQSTIGLFGLLLFVSQSIEGAHGSIIIVEDAKGKSRQHALYRNLCHFCGLKGVVIHLKYYKCIIFKHNLKSLIKLCI